MTRRDHRQAAAGPDAADMVDDRNVRGGLPSIHVFHEQRLKGGPSAVVLRRQTWGRWVVDGGPVPGTLVDALTAGGEDVAGVLADAGACRDGDDLSLIHI